MKKTYIFLTVLITSFCVNAQTLYFPPTTGNIWDTISPQSLNWCQSQIDSLYAYLDTNNTKAFILLKDGKIVLEKYFGTHTQVSPWQWASAGKTITSFMVGMTQQENYLSIADTTSKYLSPVWTNCTIEQEEKISIRHQLTMTSGLDDGVVDNFCTLDTCLIYKADAGTRWAYHNGPYTLLDNVIENATGISLNAYITQKLKNPTGMTGAFVSLGYNNVFFSNARSMARFGLLILNNGNWNGTQIMTDTAYFNQMVNTSQSLNQAYGYLWWLNGKSTFMIPVSQIIFHGSLSSNAPSDMFVAMGKDGQLLNIVPSQNLVWLRMGNSSDELSVPFLMNDKIWKFINSLDCNTIGLYERPHSPNLVQISPNPCNGNLNIKSDKQMLKIEIYNIHGQCVKNINAQNKDLRISINDLSSGFYLIKVDFNRGSPWIGKLIRE